MASVFSGFVFSNSVMIQSIGFGLAIGVLLDAFVVRLLIIPAVMHLLGDAAWWLPKWLDRILPNVDVEGASLERTHPVHPTDEPEPSRRRRGASRLARRSRGPNAAQSPHRDGAAFSLCGAGAAMRVACHPHSGAAPAHRAEGSVGGERGRRG